MAKEYHVILRSGKQKDYYLNDDGLVSSDFDSHAQFGEMRGIAFPVMENERVRKYHFIPYEAIDLIEVTLHFET